jgi:hypothetical protein
MGWNWPIATWLLGDQLKGVTDWTGKYGWVMWVVLILIIVIVALYAVSVLRRR